MGQSDSNLEPIRIIKTIHVYVDSQIEFDIPITSDDLTCGWLLKETTRRYITLKREGKRRKIVALKSTD